MLLEKLTISSKNGIIRDIPFKLQGLNLVIDTTPITEDLTLSGNNVGKTTFIRCVDFCFGSNGKAIYQDKEMKNDNEQVKDFLFENKVEVTLSILKSDNSKTTLKRSFEKDADLFIDDIQYKNKNEYCAALNHLLFHIKPEEKKVSLRNIIKKFVRCDEFSENNILKILHNTSFDEIYETLYLKLFGFPDENILTERLKIAINLKKLKKEIRYIGGKTSLPKLQNRLIQLQKVIEENERKIKTIDLPKTYDKLIKKLNELKSKTAGLSSFIGNLNTKISFSQKTRNELVNNKSNIDPKAIKQLYEEAKSFLPKIQKQFEDVLEFHNKMITNKIKFVELHIKKLENERNEKKQELDTLLKDQSGILQLLENTGTFDDLLKIREEINVLYTEKGKLVAQIESIQSLQNQISELSLKNDELNLKFASFLEELNNNIQNIFNKYFKLYTSQTHGEQLYIYYDPEKQNFDFDNLKGNVGDGYKKTEIISFDLAFISFFNEMGLDFPKFILHDKLEIIHKNQIQTIFDIANSVNGQFIVSVLKERIAFLGDQFIDNRKILELSQDDKFFKF